MVLFFITLYHQRVDVNSRNVEIQLIYYLTRSINIRNIKASITCIDDTHPQVHKYTRIRQFFSLLKFLKLLMLHLILDSLTSSNIYREATWSRETNL